MYDFVFTVKILNCERSIFSSLLYKSKWFLLTVRWFESHYCLLRKSVESTIHCTSKFHGEVKRFDLTVSWQHLKMQLLGFLLHLSSMWIYLLDVETNFQPKFSLSDLIQEEMCSELSVTFWLTCFFRTGRRENNTLCFSHQLELSSFYSLIFFFFMFLVSKLQGNFQAKEHGLIIFQNHDPEICCYIFLSHLKGLFN